jgi:hypothetical protein
MRYLLMLSAVLLWAGCSSKMIRFEQYSLAMNLPVAADTTVHLGSDEHFQGILGLGPIMLEEKQMAKSVKVIRNYGAYYLSADKFKNVWLIIPEDDGQHGTYQAIDPTPDDTSDVVSEIYFSRYGQGENTCVKFRSAGKEIFIDREGKINEKCN